MNWVGVKEIWQRLMDDNDQIISGGQNNIVLP